MTEEHERAAFEREMSLAGVSVGRRNSDGEYIASHIEGYWLGWTRRAALSQPASEPVAWRCRSWGADEWAYFDHDDKPETVAPAQLKPLYDRPASDEAAEIMEWAHVFMVRPQGESNYDQVEARLKAYVNRVDVSPAPEATDQTVIALIEQVEFVLQVTAPMTPQQEQVWPMLSVRARDARAALMNLNRASPAAPNEGLSHLNANGAEAWKDVPRTGDWVADLK